MDFPEALFRPLLLFFVTKDKMVSIRRLSRRRTTWRSLKRVKRLVRVCGFWVTYKVLFKVVTLMYSHIHTTLVTRFFFISQSFFSFAKISLLNVTEKPCLNLFKLEQMFNKRQNSDYEGEIHHLFKLRDMKKLTRVTSKLCFWMPQSTSFKLFFIYSFGRHFL